MRAARLLTVGSVVAAAGAGLVVTAAPAGAATISAPNVVTSPGTVTITAKTDAAAEAKLLFNGRTVASASALQLGSTLAYKFATLSMRNGSYSAVLQEQLLVLPWHNAASATIELRIPPSPPLGVAARLVSGRTVRVTWARGAEPDLTSYSVVSTAGGGAGVGVGTACGSGSCSAALTVPGDAALTAGFAVVAHRSDGAGGTLASGASPTAYVSVRGSRASTAGGSAPSSGSVGGGSGSQGAGTGQGGAGTAGGNGGDYRWAMSGESPALVLPTVRPQGGLALPISGTKMAPSRPAAGPWAGSAGWYPAVAAILVLLLAAAHAAAWSSRKRHQRRVPAAPRAVPAAAEPAPSPHGVPSLRAAPPLGAAASTRAAANRRGNGPRSHDLSPANRTQAS